MSFIPFEASLFDEQRPLGRHSRFVPLFQRTYLRLIMDPKDKDLSSSARRGFNPEFVRPSDGPLFSSQHRSSPSLSSGSQGSGVNPSGSNEATANATAEQIKSIISQLAAEAVDKRAAELVAARNCR